MSIQHRVFSHNPYFNRWFSAIKMEDFNLRHDTSHNPYFNRWFSAIKKLADVSLSMVESQSLF